jgi:hypothetical protein
MLRSFTTRKPAAEGYVYNAYGHPKYLKHAVASVISLRRYDDLRPVALFCDDKLRQLLEDHGLSGLFDLIDTISPEHASIVGFKHNTHQYMPFERNLYLDSDILWCKDPSQLWTMLSTYGYTITGTKVADNFFGAPKHIGVVWDMLLRRRGRTLKRFGLSYLSRVQSGMIFAQDYAQTRKVNEVAGSMLRRKAETHFQSRTQEHGRSEESCEWSLAMAMSKLTLPVIPWLQGQTSPQLDFIEHLTTYDPDFHHVECVYYSDAFVYNLRGLKQAWLRAVLKGFATLIPGKGDHLSVTPYALHFGWYHQKRPFFEFAERTWNTVTSSSYRVSASVKNRLMST